MELSVVARTEVSGSDGTLSSSSRNESLIFCLLGSPFSEFVDERLRFLGEEDEFFETVGPITESSRDSELQQGVTFSISSTDPDFLLRSILESIFVRKNE